MEQRENYIVIETRDGEDAFLRTDQNLVVGDIVVRADGGTGDIWQRPTGHLSGAIGRNDPAYSINEVAVVLKRPEAAARVTLGQARQPNLDPSPWQPGAIVRFTKDFNMKGPIGRAEEALTSGQYLTLRWTGTEIEFEAVDSLGAATYCAWATVTKAQSSPTGNIEITTAGCPVDIAVT